MAASGRRDYFERQNDRDCTIHSLNNAAGRQVISKQQVMAYIDEKAVEFAKKNRVSLDSPEVVGFRSRVSDGSSFFAARIVWDAAMAAGTVSYVSAIPGFGGAFAKLWTLPSWAAKAPMIFLGLEPKRGETHAVGARGGKLYDSVREPVTLTDAELKKSLKKVFAAYIVTFPGGPKYYVSRTKPMAV